MLRKCGQARGADQKERDRLGMRMGKKLFFTCA